MSKAKTAETDEGAVLDGATYEAMSPGPTKVILAGMFHANPKLIGTEMSEAAWQAAIDKFLKQPTS